MIEAATSRITEGEIRESCNRNPAIWLFNLIPAAAHRVAAALLVNPMLIGEDLTEQHMRTYAVERTFPNVFRKPELVVQPTDLRTTEEPK